MKEHPGILHFEVVVIVEISGLFSYCEKYIFIRDSLFSICGK